MLTFLDNVKNPMVKEALDWAFHIVIALLIGLFIVNFVVQRTIVRGNSMQPTLQDENQLLIEKVSQRFSGLHRGDIVTVYVPESLGEGRDYIIKRIIGVEKDHVQLKDGKVYVNGTALDEDYINGDTTLAGDQSYNDVTVPEGYVYVLGDNRLPNASMDSRYIGLISEDRVRGKAFLRYFPLNEIGGVK